MRRGFLDRDRDEPFEELVELISRLESRLAWRRTVLVLAFGGIAGGLLDIKLAIFGAAVAIVSLAGDVHLGFLLARSVGELRFRGAPPARAVLDWLGLLQCVSRLRAQAFWIGQPLTGVLNILRGGIGQAVAAGWRPDGRVALRLLSDVRRQALDDYLAVSNDPAELVEFLVATLLVVPRGVLSGDVDVLRALATGARTQRLRSAAQVAVQNVTEKAIPPSQEGVTREYRK